MKRFLILFLILSFAMVGCKTFDRKQQKRIEDKVEVAVEPVKDALDAAEDAAKDIIKEEVLRELDRVFYPDRVVT
jgi:hypothetical protein